MTPITGRLDTVLPGRAGSGSKSQAMKNALISLATIAILATSVAVCGAGKAKTISAPDLTVGTNRYGVNRKFTYNLGPTGMREIGRAHV